MHEASVAADLLAIVRQEMDKRHLKKLIKIKIRCGQLSCVSAHSLAFNLDIMLQAEHRPGVILDIEEEPVVLSCAGCGRNFSPAHKDALLDPCPDCGRETGHQVLTGQDLNLVSIEAE